MLSLCRTDSYLIEAYVITVHDTELRTGLSDFTPLQVDRYNSRSMLRCPYEINKMEEEVHEYLQRPPEPEHTAVV